MMESRKRPLPLDEDAPMSKKRALMSSSGSPTAANGLSLPGVEPREDDNLEQFRKEAIFRRMRYYSRENERAQRRILELERYNEKCQAGLAAMETCWNMLLSELSLLASIEPSADDSQAWVTLPKFEEDSDDVSPYASALQEKHVATKGIVEALVQRASSSPSRELVTLHRQCSQAQSELLVAQAERNLLRSRLDQVERQLESCKEQLATAEIRADRARSESAVNLNSAQAPSIKQENGEEAQIDVPDTPLAPPAIDTKTEQQHQDYDLLAVLKSREDRIVQMEGHLSQLEMRLTQLHLQVKSPPDELVKESAIYKILEKSQSDLLVEVETARKELAELEKSSSNIMEHQVQFENKMKTEFLAPLDELKKELAKRESEAARLRDHRDAVISELAERKTLLFDKFNALNEMKKLVNARAERIVQLQSQVRRLQAQMAAEAGRGDLVTLLLEGSDDAPTLVEDLRQKLETAEKKIAALEASLAKHEPKAAVVAEVELRTELREAKRQLEAFENVFGLDALPPDQAKLAERLREKEERLQALELLRKQEAEALNAMYMEVDRLSASWEAMETQVKSKVFDLSALEDKVARLTAEKAKADNKYFATIRAKDLSDAELKAQIRRADTAQQGYDREAELLKTANVQLENAMTQVKSLHGELQASNASRKRTEAELASTKTHLQCETAKLAEIEKSLKQRDAEVATHRQTVRAQDEAIIKLKNEVARSAAALSIPGAETEDEEKGLTAAMKILKCSTCKINFRNTVLSKCGHTFCKTCLDARLSTRQRKCPACNQAFAQSDVIVYFTQ